MRLLVGREPGKETLMLYRIALVALLVSQIGCGRLQLGDKNKGKDMDIALRGMVQSSARPSFVTQDQEGARLWKLTQQFYQKRNYAPAWIRDNAAPRSKMEALTKALREADKEGLDPELYAFSALEKKRQEASEGFLSKKGFDPKEAGMLEAWLTYLYMKYASDLADGLSDLAQADPAWQIRPEKVDPLAHLEQALEQNRIVESLYELTPNDSEYRNLRQALADYRAQAARGGWPAVPANLKLKPGQKHAQLRPLAERLAASGDFKGSIPADGGPTVYDQPLQEAVKQFQRRHGMQDDGIVSPALVAELNVPIEQRIDSLELNLERWRWLPR